MATKLTAVEKAAEAAAKARAALEAAIVDAHRAGESHRAIARACGLSHERVRQLVKAAAPDEDAMRARLAELDARWESFVDDLAPQFEADNPLAEQARRNVLNGKIRRAQSGVNRAGRASGSVSPVRGQREVPTVRAEARALAEALALKFLEDRRGHALVERVVAELDEAFALRQSLAALQDARTAF